VTRTQSFKNGIILLALTTLSACITSQTRFPEYSELVKKHSSVPVVVDLFVYRDIAGVSRGYNEEINDSALNDATEQIEESLTQRGYSVNLLAALNGLTHEADKNIDYVISEDWKSSGKAYTKPHLSATDNPWHTNSIKHLLTNLLNVGKEIDFAKDKDQAYAQRKVIEKSENSDKEPSLAINEIEIEPSLFDGIESDVVLFIQVDGRFQKLGKYLAKGVPIGALSYALTGGVFIMPPGSYAIAEAVAFDVKSRQILWHNRGYAEGKNSVIKAVKDALFLYPYSDGESHYDKRKKAR